MNYKRVVIKIGTTTLTYANSKLNLKLIDKLARVLVDLRNQGIEVVLVSSGAIAVGASRLGIERPRDLIGKQATSAVGQAILMQIYEKIFIEYNQVVAQILLTKDVIDMKERKVHAKNTMSTLLSMGVIPIVNENDTVSSEQIEFSDNDTLSAYVATLIDSDLLVILSDIDALYDSDPNKNSDAKPIREVNEINDYIRTIATGSASVVGTGGMATKIKAAEICEVQKIETVIASGKDPYIIYDIIEGKETGTRFIWNK